MLLHWNCLDSMLNHSHHSLCTFLFFWMQYKRFWEQQTVKAFTKQVSWTKFVIERSTQSIMSFSFLSHIHLDLFIWKGSTVIASDFAPDSSVFFFLVWSFSYWPFMAIKALIWWGFHKRKFHTDHRPELVLWSPQWWFWWQPLCRLMRQRSWFLCFSDATWMAPS